MSVFWSIFFLGGLVVLLVGVFHSFLWNFGGGWSVSIRSWVSSFECGFVSQRIVENYFSHTYFILLVFFVVFDLEVSLLLNMPLQGVLFKNFLYYVVFIIFLGSGFGAEVYKGYADWGY